MSFQREDIEEGQYDWNSITSFSGVPTRRAFDRFNGHQVLFMINNFETHFPDFTIREARLLEFKIRNELPLDARSEISVFNWLRESIPVE